MEPHNKKGLIWIVAFFLILNSGLALLAFMWAPTGSQQCCCSARSIIQTGADLVRYRLRAKIFASISGKQTTSEPTRILADTW